MANPDRLFTMVRKSTAFDRFEFIDLFKASKELYVKDNSKLTDFRLEPDGECGYGVLMLFSVFLDENDTPHGLMFEAAPDTYNPNEDPYPKSWVKISIDIPDPETYSHFLLRM